MRLKLDENLPHDLADELTRRGHDVDTVLDEQLGGRKDPVSILTLIDRLLDVRELEEFSRCVAIVEPQRVRVRRPEDLEQP